MQINNSFKRYSATCIYCLIILIISPFYGSSQVKLIDWANFKKGSPTDSLSLSERDILLNTNKYALTTWYNDVKKFNVQSNDYLDLGGNDEHNIRAIGSEAFALAVAIKTGIYDESITHVPLKKATGITIKLIRSASYKHQSNSNNGWGDHWQRALWAAYTGAAAWMMWDELDPQDRMYVQKMIEHEANRLNNYKVPYLRDKAGNFLSEGNSRSEENSWESMILQVAVAMMPHHMNKKIWMNKNIELMLSASAMPEDVNSNKKFHGKKLKDILNGSNYNEDGTVTNHSRIHPDYMACTSQTFFNALMFSLAEQPTPKAAFFNTDIIYRTMVDHQFKSPPYNAPGGTIYISGSSDIYYPQVNDWGENRRMHFALMDCQMSAFGMDKLASKNGKYWESYHALEVSRMQKRNTDGRTYQDSKEDTYKGREEWVAMHAAQAYLTKWIMHQKKFSVSNKKY